MQAILSAKNTIANDTGLKSLCYIAARYGSNISALQLEQSLGLSGLPIGINEIILAAKSLNLQARSIRSTWQRLKKTPLPALAILNDGTSVVVLRLHQDKIVLHFTNEPDKVFSCDETQFCKAWTGRLILVKSKKGPSSDRSFGIKWFLPPILKYRHTLIEIFVAAFFVQLFALSTPLFSQVIIDKVLMHKNVATLHVLGVGMIILMLFESCLMFVQNYLTAHTASRIDIVLGNRVVQHLFRLPIRYFEARRVGSTVAHIRELEAIRQFITGTSISAVLDFIFIFIFLAVMFFYSVTLTVTVLAILPFFIALTLLLRPLIREQLTEKFAKGAEYQSFLIEALNGVTTIKSMAIEPILHRKWLDILSGYVRATFHTNQLGNIGTVASGLIQKAANLAILWVGAGLVMDSELTVGQLIAFQMLSGRVISPIVRIVQLWQDFQQVGLSIQRLGDIMGSQPEALSSSDKEFISSIRGNITITDMTFKYAEAGQDIIKNLCLQVAEGQTIGIVGRSGSGKSTLAKLLQRLYLPTRGKIFIDGIDIMKIDAHWLRRQIGVVLQENFLFDGTIRENIAIHCPEANAASIIEAAKLAGAHEFISELENGYDTPIGERGTGLSGGQRQRIAIARALITNPKILIFDEATSALDYESERLIQDNLAQICEGRTVFIIAHRLSTVRGADAILVFDKGVLVEQGSHAQLISLRGAYFNLFSQHDKLAYEI